MNNNFSRNNRPPLNLLGVRLFTEKNEIRVYNNTFYKNHDCSLGIEIKIRNNTSVRQNMKLGGCVYNDKNEKVAKWYGENYIKPLSDYETNLWVGQQTFSNLRTGQYTVQIWVNNVSFKQTFTIERSRNN